MTTELVELADRLAALAGALGNIDPDGGSAGYRLLGDAYGEAEELAAAIRALASRAGGSEVAASPTFTMREIVQALTEHYKDQTGDQRQVPAAITAFETMQQLVRIIERNRDAAAPEPVGA